MEVININIKPEKSLRSDMQVLSDMFMALLVSGNIPGTIKMDNEGLPVCDYEGRVKWLLYMPLHVVEDYWVANNIYNRDDARIMIAKFLKNNRVIGYHKDIAGSRKMM